MITCGRVRQARPRLVAFNSLGKELAGTAEAIVALTTTMCNANLPWAIGDLVSGTRGGGKRATTSQPSG